MDDSFTINRVTLFVDDPQSWIMPWVEQLLQELSPAYHVVLEHRAELLSSGDVCFLLGCTRLLPPEKLALHKLNLVIHESALPEGRGFSPVAWQVLAGRNSIPVTLFAATDKPDAGPVYLRDVIELRGDELWTEIRALQGAKTVELALRFLRLWPTIIPTPQVGEATFFRRRTRADDALDVDKTLAEQFDRLRVADNVRYPAWFTYRGRSYVLRLEPLAAAPSEGSEATGSTHDEPKEKASC